LTPIGRELLQILPPSNDELTAREIFAKLGDSIDQADIMRIVERLPDGTFRFEFVEKLK
jgi:hypothetical protein